MVGFIITVIISLIVAFAGDMIVRSTMPGGPWVTFLIALMGSWVGGYMSIFKGIGFRYNDLNIIPSIIGAILFVFIYGFFRKAIAQAKI